MDKKLQSTSDWQLEECYKSFQASGHQFDEVPAFDKDFEYFKKINQNFVLKGHGLPCGSTPIETPHYVNHGGATAVGEIKKDKRKGFYILLNYDIGVNLKTIEYVAAYGGGQNSGIGCWVGCAKDILFYPEEEQNKGTRIYVDGNVTLNCYLSFNVVLMFKGKDGVFTVINDLAIFCLPEMK